MAGKVWLGVLLAFSLLFTSCYPQLSVQQYDQLRKDIADLDVQRQSLEKETAALKEESAALKAKHAEIRAYMEFLNKLVATQSSEKIVSGKLLFDVDSLISAKEELTKMARDLGDNDIIYYLELMKSDTGSQTVAAYYKAIEYCLKRVRQNLE
ncbi:MAG: hypothetical protein HYX80_10070 [Chloroflexi bacterium]|nr:hypothetical protein [Chloroflexota bacterium]